jgi:hypothetical protein
MSSRDEILREYQQAVEREGELREHAFLDCYPWEIQIGANKYPIRIMRLRDFAALCATGNLCVDDPKQADPSDIFSFCHVLRFHENLTPEETAALLGPMPFDALRQCLFDYVDLIFCDAPASEGQRRKPYYSYLASIIHSLAKSYGWSRNEILDTPMPAIYQLLKIMQQEANPKMPLFNRSDAILNKLAQSGGN